MNDLLLFAKGLQKRFPKGNEPFQITTRLLEECGEVAKEVNHFEDSGIKRLKYGEPNKEHLANEIKQAMSCLAQLVVYYDIEEEIERSIQDSLTRLRSEGYIE